MIASIEGKLVQLEDGKALVQVGSIGYEIMLAGYCQSELAGRIGTEVQLCTIQYYEGSPGGGNLIPRMVGFLSRAEREFFESYTSVKGMGTKKALKSLSMPIATIAAAVENGDEKILGTLPGVGKRMSQQIIAQLRGKLGTFAADAEAAVRGRSPFESFETEALEILIAWGEKRSEAIELIESARAKHPDITTAEGLVPVVYRLKQGIEI